MDIRQSPQWGKFLTQIGWTTEKIGRTQILIRKIPLFRYSLIKIQRPKNPLPFEKIDQLAKRHHALFVLIEPEIEKYNETSFKKSGFGRSILTLTHTATINIDLEKPMEGIFRSFSENAKRNIKKAQKNGLKIEKIFLNDAKNNDDFLKFYKLLENLTKIKKFYNPGFDEFYNKMLAFKKNSILFFAHLGNNSQPVAAVWVSFLGSKMSYFHTGITKEGYNSMANYLLVWEALKTAKDLKLKSFDFEGIYDPRFPKERKKWINFSEFKKRFHGKIIEYPQPWIKCYSNFYKLLYICNKVFYR